MSDDNYQNLEKTMRMILKGTATATFAVISFVAVKAYEKSEERWSEMSKDVREINEKLNGLTRKVDKLENYNEFEEKQREKK
jgi:hypothetical protein